MRRLTFPLLICFAFLLIYYPALFNFFTQDDFSLLLISQAKDFKEFVQLFKPLNTAIFYRPLSMQLFFYLTRTVFGLRPLAFHLIAFLFHLLNSFLVYHLIKILTRNKQTAFLVAFCYAVSSVHFMSLFWICEFSLILSAFFSFLSLISYLHKKQYSFIFFFLLALLSNELSATLPLIILSYHLILKKPLAWKKLILPVIFIGSFIFLRFFWFTTSLGESYKPHFTPGQFLSGLRWYLFRSLSLPELIKDFLDKEPFLKLNLFTAVVFLFSSFLVPSFLLFIKKKRKINFKILLFAFSWFALSLLPVIFMPKHLLSSYLTIGLPGILLFWLYHLSLLQTKFKKILIVIALGSFFASSLISVRFLKKHHWIVYRAKIAEKNIQNLLKTTPKFENKSIIYFEETKPNSAKELYLALSGEAAIKVFYNNPTLQVFFEGFQKFPEGEEKKIYLVPALAL